MEDILTTVISVLGGGIAGFLSSLFFWRADKRLIRPRLSLEILEKDQGGYELGLKNEGGSFAEDVSYTLSKGGGGSLDYPIKPDGVHKNIRANVNDDYLLTVTYRDVFGEEYSNYWQVIVYDYNADDGYPDLIIAQNPYDQFSEEKLPWYRKLKLPKFR